MCMCFHASQIIMAHKVWGVIASGLAFSWARLCGAGLGRKIRAIPSLRCAIRQIFERPYQALGIEDKAPRRSVEKLPNPGWLQALH